MNTYVEAFESLLGLLELEEGWSDDGASKIDREILSSVSAFMVKLADMGVSPPWPVPLSDGRIQLEWRKGGHYVEFEFVDPTNVIYIDDDHAGNTGQGSLYIDDKERVLDILKHFVKTDDGVS